eukprot:TRINITY_DN10875_c0_g1_i1.p1 TRINITY_DN10875_c0_g1~~TRINITY_DN10875_c0_g1_i1.p1  ORF type:complete len:449 (+),score=139.75 TRINITY_DN10875_c0_g1_i1:67-1413(+)
MRRGSPQSSALGAAQDDLLGMMRASTGSGGASHRMLLAVCSVSILSNMFLLMQSSVPSQAGAQCSAMLSKCEAAHQAQQKMLAAIKAQLGRGAAAAAGSGASAACQPCPECPDCPRCEGQQQQQEAEDAGGESAARGGGSGKDPPWVWIPGRERVGLSVTRPEGKRTDNTVYNPADDAKLQVAHASDKNAYARSPVPMGSARIRVQKTPEKWITLDEFAFAHDVFFEEWQRFSFGKWLGVYCQQDPMDAFAIQDMLWTVKPDLIIEVGTNNGGGAIFYGTIMKMYNPNGKIVTLDVKPVSQNWMTGPNARNCDGCITGEKHPLWTNSSMINFIQGDIQKRETQEKVEEFVRNAKVVVAVEDASHRYPDTLHRMNAIYKYVTPGSYMLVQDTKMDRFVSRLRKKYGGLKFGPMRAVDEFIRAQPNWEIDRRYEYYIYSQHHRGFLRRTR